MGLILQNLLQKCKKMKKMQVLSQAIRHRFPKTKNIQKYVSKSQQSVNHVRSSLIFKVVGKTSLIQKFVKSTYSTQYSVTVGADFSCRSIVVEESLVQLQIWDTCGNDVYRSMASSFYRGACGVFLVFALNDRRSFQKLQLWYDQFQQAGSPNAMIILIGTKSDQQHIISTEQGMSMMKKIGGMFYVQTSAQTGQQIQQLFNKTAQLMYKKYKISHQFRVLAQPRKHNKSSILINDFVQQTENTNGRMSRLKKKCC